MLSSPLIVFTDKVTDRHTDTETDKSDHNTPSQNLWRGNDNDNNNDNRYYQINISKAPIQNVQINFHCAWK